MKQGQIDEAKSLII